MTARLPGPAIPDIRSLEAEILRLRRRLAALEERLDQLESGS